MTTLQARCQAVIDAIAPRQRLEYDGAEIEWAAVQGMARSLTQRLRAAGLPAGSRIGFTPRNRPSSIAALIGLIAAEMTVVMIYGHQPAAGIAAHIARSRLAAFVGDRQDCVGEVAQAAAALPAGGFVLAAADVKLVAGTGDDIGVATEPPGVHLLTSGTTGPPKLHAFSYEQIERMVGDNVANAGGSDVPPALLYFPLSNIAGLRAALAALLNGQSAILLDRFTVEAWREHIVRYRPATISAPTAAFSMALDAGLAVEDFASLRAIFTGAAPLSQAVQDAFEQRYRVPVLLVYGATEFGGPVTQFTLSDREKYGSSKRGSVGLPYGGNRIRVRDLQSGELMPAGGVGRLEVISERMGPDWIVTNDLGAVDADGFLFLHGRADGAINRGGFKLAPEAIEAVLTEHPAIVAAAVVALPDERLGEVPGAAVVPAAGAILPLFAELEARLRHRLSAMHVPVAWATLSELPRNPLLKIDRAAVRQAVLSQHERATG